MGFMPRGCAAARAHLTPARARSCKADANVGANILALPAFAGLSARESPCRYTAAGHDSPDHLRAPRLAALAAARDLRGTGGVCQRAGAAVAHGRPAGGLAQCRGRGESAGARPARLVEGVRRSTIE